MKKSTRISKRIQRHKRVRAKVSGSGIRPRLSVFKSRRHLHLQLIDDALGQTLVASSTAEVKGGGNKTERGSAAARLLAERALKAGIKQVVFDRGGNKYHGRVKAAAEAVRASGLKF